MMEHRNGRLRNLGLWQEIVDVLVEVDYEGGALVFSRCTVSVPLEVLERLSKLTSLVGRRVRLLRTDLPDRQYIVTDPKHVSAKRADAHRNLQAVSRYG